VKNLLKSDGKKGENSSEGKGRRIYEFKKKRGFLLRGGVGGGGERGGGEKYSPRKRIYHTPLLGGWKNPHPRNLIGKGVICLQTR